MSINMESMDEADYSDYEYQIVVHEHSHVGSNDESNPNTTVKSTAEPLADVGGLDVNEVAELVYYEIEVNLEHEQAGFNQTEASSTNGRGAFGANLASNKEIMPNPDRAGDLPTDIVENKRGTASVDAFSRVTDNIFSIFEVQGSPAFDDAADSGAGGGEGVGFVSKERNYRQLTGRGPVLDSNDDLNIITRLAGENTVQGEQINVRLHLVWDTAEVDDAGRAFSVPR